MADHKVKELMNCRFTLLAGTYACDVRGVSYGLKKLSGLMAVKEFSHSSLSTRRLRHGTT